MAQWKNDFKFFTKKPEYKKLWDLLDASVVKDLPEYSREDVKLTLFFYLSKNEWKTARVALTDTSAVNSIMRSHPMYRVPTKSIYLEYSHVVPNPDDIPYELLLIWIVSGGNTDLYKSAFDKNSVPDNLLRFLSMGSNAPLDKFFTDLNSYFITSDPSNVIEVYSKKEIETRLTEAYIQDKPRPFFKLGEFEDVPF